MTPERTIIFAFESRKILSSVLRVVHESENEKYIIASRIADLISILKTVRPTLIVFGFYNNQEAIYTLSQICRYSRVPFLCLKEDNERLSWKPESIVFTLSLFDSFQGNVLSRYINSILRLSESTNGRRANNSLLNDSMRRSFVDNNDDTMSKYVMELEKRKSVLLHVKKKIKELYADADQESKGKLLSLMNLIRNETSKEKSGEEFDVYFNRIRPAFLNKLHSRHPGLTPKDIKYCCFLCLNMSNNEIRNLLGINQESVRTHQYRLKKKLALPKKISLREYVNTLASSKAN